MPRMKRETILEELGRLLMWLKRNGFPGSRRAIMALSEAIKLLKKEESA